jgi:hypothetical protein
VGSLYGPVSTEVLLERIRNGSLTTATLVCEDGHDDFVPILQHPTLKAAAEKAFEQAEVLKEKQQVQRKKQQRMTLTMVAVALLCAVAVGGGYYGFREWKRAEADEAKRLRDEEILAKKQKADAEAKAKAELAQKNSELEVDMELLPLVSVNATVKKQKKGKRGGSVVDEGPQGCQLDQASMVSTFRGSFPQIKSCVRDQASRGGVNLPDTLTLTFTIANTGSVVSFETDDRNIRGTPFFDCLKKTVTNIHFQKFPGERCNIDYPITIGKRK